MIRPRSIIALCLVTALSLVAMPAAATHNNQGTVKVHDNEEEDPAMRNVPHVDCEFWVEGFNMGDSSGWLVFYGWPPTGDMSVVWTGEDQNWTADPWTEEHGFHFLAGPFTLPTGHYRVEVYTDEGHPGETPEGGNPHFAKSKTFWVDCEETENPPCPVITSVEAGVSGETPFIELEWEAVVGAEAYVVYRAVEGGEFEMLAHGNETMLSYTDEDVVVGTTYEYYVTAVIGGQESENCEIVEATAIPFFPTWIVGALALAGSVGAFVLLRRRF